MVGTGIDRCSLPGSQTGPPELRHPSPPSTSASDFEGVGDRPACLSRTSFNRGGRGFPLFSERLKIPTQARALKRYFSGGLSIKIEDKEDSTASLGNSPTSGVQDSPRNGKLVCHDLSAIGPSDSPPP